MRTKYDFGVGSSKIEHKIQQGENISDLTFNRIQNE